jgi:hypothetical protein
LGNYLPRPALSLTDKLLVFVLSISIVLLTCSMVLLLATKLTAIGVSG